MASKKVLVLGARGMLGQELVRVFSLDERYALLGWDREDIDPAPIVHNSGSTPENSSEKSVVHNRCWVDVTDFTAAEKKIREYAPEIILNCVAYNAVDACEESDEEYQNALLLNAEVPKFLARVAKETGAVLVHYSTDYVFDGEKSEGYKENDVPQPLSKYGMSKFTGEKAVIESFVIPVQTGIQNSWIPSQARDDREENENGGYYLIRLSKLFGQAAASAAAKKSFFEKMLEAADSTKLTAEKTKEVVQVVDDEKSCFTYAPDLAVATKELIESGDSFGTYHLVNTGGVTWYEAAKELYAQAHIGVTIQPVGSDVFLRKALRPRCSTLLNTKRPLLRPYQEALKEYLSEMQNEKIKV